jgi:hypothetical protein
MLGIQSQHPSYSYIKGAYSNEYVPKVFKQRLDDTNIMERTYRLLDSLNDGTFFTMVDAHTLDRLQVSKELFTPYKGVKMYQLFADAMVIYATFNQDSTTKTDEFLLNKYGNSLFLSYAKQAMEKEAWNKLYKELTPDHKTLIGSYSTAIGVRFSSWINYIQWYTHNQKDLSLINRGVWNISPMNTLQSALSVYLGFVIDNLLKSCYVGSPQWYDFLEYLEKEYQITTEGDTETDIVYTTDYTHENIVTPLSLYDKLKGKL